MSYRQDKIAKATADKYIGADGRPPEPQAHKRARDQDHLHDAFEESSGQEASEGGRDVDPPTRASDLQSWKEPVSGDELLDELVHLIERYVVLPAGAADAVALWAVFAHAHDAFMYSPILGISSPTPACGKSTLLTVLSGLVPRPLMASNVSPASVFRAIEELSPSLLIDEADTYLSGNSELRGALNSGHLRSNARFLRAANDTNGVKEFSTWAPKSIALIGGLPETLESRSIHVELVRKAEDEVVEQLRPDRMDHLVPVRMKAARWAADSFDALQTADPEIPASLKNRAADNVRPLIAIADLAGGDWPERARRAAELLCAQRDDATPGIMLLEDIRHVFGTGAVDRIPSANLAKALAQMEGRPWPEFRGRHPITPNQIAKLLRQFGIRPETIRIRQKTLKGYLAKSFDDAFSRYLSARP